MTVTWMRENSCKDWQVGITFVQFQKNLSYHLEIKRTPYKAMFGVEAKVGLTSSSLPDEIISKSALKMILKISQTLDLEMTLTLLK
jgi:antitoxin component HigA of HigAB toxin-antitoxin module